MPTPRIDFSVHNKHRKVLEIIDSWKQKGSYSDKICLAIEKLHAEEEKGSKITQFTGEQSRLPTLPPVYEIPHPEDLEGLSYEELRTLFFSAQEWTTLSRKKIEILQKQR